MVNPVKDIDSLTSLKRAINKFNRNSDIVKIDTNFESMSLYIYLNNLCLNNYDKLRDDENYVLKTEHLKSHYYMFQHQRGIIIYDRITIASINELILLLNKIFSCLNHNVPKKSDFEEHMGLAHELVSEWPQWKQDILAHTKPAIYNPPDPQ